jgi:ribosomal protein S18 acetylase RimI-like enzyme
MYLRPMTKLDIPSGMRLKEIAGWNQTAQDWERFLTASPDGCFVAELAGEVCGTVTTISYEERFAWVGMVLVDPEFRGRGIGAKLLARAIEHLDAGKISTIKLDATPLGKPLYEKLGFVSEYEIERWILRTSSVSSTKTHRSRPPGLLSPDPLDSIFELDRDIFGADRSSLLESLHQEVPDFTFAMRNASIVEGYGFGRHGCYADHLGPWMATDAQVARQLLEAFLASCGRDTIVVDCLKSNTMARNLLQSFGFTYSRPLTRMYRGANLYPGRVEPLCAILGPEFG